MESEKLSYQPMPVETSEIASDDFKTPFQKTVRKWLLGMLGLGLAICVWSVLLYFSKPDVVLLTNVLNAQVFLDGQLVGTTNQVGKIKLPKVRTGKRILSVIHRDFADFTKEVDVQSTFFPITVNAKLRPALFTLTVITNPPMAKVLIDDQEIGETSLAAGELQIPEVRRGQHKVTVQRSGYEDYQETLELDGDRSLSITLMTTLSGFWKGSSSSNAPNSSYNFALELKQSGTAIVGSWEEIPALTVSSAPQSPKPKVYSIEGGVNGKQVTLTRRDEKGQVTTYEAQVAETGKDITGSWKSARIAGAWFATRSEIKPVLNSPVLQPPPTSSFAGPGPTLISPQPFDPGSGTADALREAQQLYEQREYQAALRQCDVILKTDPKNVTARMLKAKIQKTLEILNQ